MLKPKVLWLMMVPGSSLGHVPQEVLVHKTSLDDGSIRTRPRLNTWITSMSVKVRLPKVSVHITFALNADYKFIVD